MNSLSGRYSITPVASVDGLITSNTWYERQSRKRDWLTRLINTTRWSPSDSYITSDTRLHSGEWAQNAPPGTSESPDVRRVILARSRRLPKYPTATSHRCLAAGTLARGNQKTRLFIVVHLSFSSRFRSRSRNNTRDNAKQRSTANDTQIIEAAQRRA